MLIRATIRYRGHSPIGLGLRYTSTGSYYLCYVTNGWYPGTSLSLHLALQFLKSIETKCHSSRNVIISSSKIYFHKSDMLQDCPVESVTIKKHMAILRVNSSAKCESNYRVAYFSPSSNTDFLRGATQEMIFGIFDNKIFCGLDSDNNGHIDSKEASLEWTDSSLLPIGNNR